MIFFRKSLILLLGLGGFYMKKKKKLSQPGVVKPKRAKLTLFEKAMKKARALEKKPFSLSPAEKKEFVRSVVQASSRNASK